MACQSVSQSSSVQLSSDLLLFCTKIGAFSTSEARQVSRNSPATAGPSSSNWSNIHLYFGPNYPPEILKWSDQTADTEKISTIVLLAVRCSTPSDRLDGWSTLTCRIKENILLCLESVSTRAAQFFSVVQFMVMMLLSSTLTHFYVAV